MKALSIRQPWASLIALGIKDIENRSWATDFRGRIYIHASQKFDNAALKWMLDFGFSLFHTLLLHSNRVPRGAIIGEVDIVGCVTQSNSRWFEGEYGFVLSKPQIYDQPIPYKGKLGLFEVDQDIEKVRNTDAHNQELLPRATQSL